MTFPWRPAAIPLNASKVDSASSSDVSSSCADSECRNVGRAGGATASAPAAARSGHRLLSPGIRHPNPPGFPSSNVLVSLPEIVEVVAANAAAAHSVKQPTTPESQQIAATLLPTIQTMFARNKVSRSGSRTRTADASHAPFVDPAV